LFRAAATNQEGDLPLSLGDESRVANAGLLLGFLGWQEPNTMTRRVIFWSRTGIAVTALIW